MTSFFGGRRAARGATVVILLGVHAVWGCGDGGPAVGSPPDLPSNPALQEIVALQSARDGRELVRRLGSDDPTVRARAAFALASVQDQGAADALVALLDDEGIAVRREAAFALGQLPQTSEAIESALLERVAAEQDPAVRVSVVEALGKVGRGAASDWLAGVPASDPTAAEATLALARTLARGVATAGAVEAVMERLSHEDAGVRERAAWGLANALVESSWTGGLDRLYAALDGYDRSDPAAVPLLRALMRVRDPGARERIRTWRVESPDPRVRSAAVEALTAAQAPLDRAALLDALDDRSPLVRRTAAGALLGAPLEEREVERLVGWMEAHADEPLVVASLLKTLVAMGRGPLALRWLDRIPSDEARARVVALEAIADVAGEAATLALAQATESPDPAVSGAAVRALAIRWATTREAPPLHSLYYQAFARALRDRDPGLLPALPRLLADPAFRALGSDSLAEEARAAASLPAPPMVQPDWSLLGALGPRPRLTLETERGVITVEMDADAAPLTVQTVVSLAREGRYDGVPFHRVLPNFMAQGGDIARGDGLGQPGFRMPSELTHQRYERGTVGMARTDKDTENSQFFLTLSIQPHLDGAYTAFGRVVEGAEAMDALVEGDRILRASVAPSTGANPPP